VDGSRTIRVVKRDGSEEPFCRTKLAGTMWRAIGRDGGNFGDARALALAIEVYLDRRGQRQISSAAVFEMAVKVLRRCRLSKAARAMERHRWRRHAARACLRIRHDGGAVTEWDKSWLALRARCAWRVSYDTSRILAEQLESDLLSAGRRTVERREVLALLDGRVASYGLADAVPARLAAMQHET